MCSSMQIEVTSGDAMKLLGGRLGAAVTGGEVIELVGDIGAGKTTFTKGLALALGVTEDVQSPTFTISRVYESSRGVRLAHYDFYRLNEAGIMRAELEESVQDMATVTVIEWAEVVADVLPADSIQVAIVASGETSRTVTITAGGERSNAVLRELV